MDAVHLQTSFQMPTLLSKRSQDQLSDLTIPPLETFYNFTNIGLRERKVQSIYPYHQGQQQIS
jgi:hypothetical protein